MSRGFRGLTETRLLLHNLHASYFCSNTHTPHARLLGAKTGKAQLDELIVGRFREGGGGTQMSSGQGRPT